MRQLLSSLGHAFARITALERIIGLVIIIALMAIRLIDPAPLETARLKVFDIFQQIHPRISDDVHVVFVDIDEQSLAEYGQWPWPRTLIGDLIEKIAGRGAIVIGLDIVFAEPDRTSPSLVAESLPGLNDETRQSLLRLPDNDEYMAAKMGQTRVILGQTTFHRKTGQAGEETRDTQTSLATLGPDPRPYIFKFPSLIRNIPALEAAAAGRGVLTIIPEVDGVIRRVPLVVRHGDLIWPSLSAEMLRVATGSQALLIKSDNAGIHAIGVGGAEIPTDATGRLWLHFSHSNRDRYLSASEVLKDDPKAAMLAGKLVIVGTSALGLFDIKTTPLDSALPGPEIHAQMIENILARSQIVRPGYAINLELFLALLVGLSMIFLVPRLGAAPTLISGLAMALSLAGGAYYLFIRHGLVLDVVYPLGSSLIVFSALVFVGYFREEMQRQQIRGAFGQYLSPALVNQLAENPNKLVLGGETKEMSILFSDVRGFTTISESYKEDPQGLTRLINRLLTPLSNVISRHGGTIDKYMGDNVMAFWNAPLDNPDHAKHSCAAALEMLDSLKQLNEQRRSEAEAEGIEFKELAIGVGINTGEVVVGNMGSDLRFDYTVLGDAVNLAARLEGQTKGYGVCTIIGSVTAQLVCDEFAVLELDRIRVKGKAEPETIYTILGARAVLQSQAFKALARSHIELLNAYRSQDWPRAATLVDECRENAQPYDLSGLYDVYQQRIEAYRETAPIADWDGVFTATSK